MFFMNPGQKKICNQDFLAHFIMRNKSCTFSEKMVSILKAIKSSGFATVLVNTIEFNTGVLY